MITNCTIQCNTAGDLGGGINISGFDEANISVSVIDSVFNSNHAENRGGGLYSKDVTGLIISNTTFVKNTAATNHGGGISLEVRIKPHSENCFKVISGIHCRECANIYCHMHNFFLLQGL